MVISSDIPPIPICALVFLVASGLAPFWDSEVTSASAQSLGENVATYRSQRLVLHTDLPADESRELMQRLETTLNYAARYWGQPLRGQITCYVVHDQEQWADMQLPNRLARVIVHGIGGATVPKMVRSGNRTRKRPTVYASSSPGVAEHEIIHAYCIQTFGYAGPDWYREGMAEMIVRGCTRQSGLQCTVEQLAELRQSPEMTIDAIRALGADRKSLSTRLNVLAKDVAFRGEHVPTSAWDPADFDRVARVRADYSHGWALCYMLLHNPNYAERFKTLGNYYITNDQEAFHEIFQNQLPEMAFEYAFFRERFELGYRVDLSRWDWNTPFQSLMPNERHRTRVLAGRGYQASGVQVSAGDRYQYRAKGAWSIDGENECSANGNQDKAGRLVALVMRDFELSESVELGVEGTFVAPASGQLYLRCHDEWSQLGDNSGQVVVHFVGQ